MVLCAFFAGGLTAIFPVDNTFSFGPSPSGLSPVSAGFTIRLLPVGQGGCLHFRKTNQTSWQLGISWLWSLSLFRHNDFHCACGSSFLRAGCFHPYKSYFYRPASWIGKACRIGFSLRKSWLTCCWPGQLILRTWLDLPAFPPPGFTGRIQPASLTRPVCHYPEGQNLDACGLLPCFLKPGSHWISDPLLYLRIGFSGFLLRLIADGLFWSSACPGWTVWLTACQPFSQFSGSFLACIRAVFMPGWLAGWNTRIDLSFAMCFFGLNYFSSWKKSFM